MSREVFSGCEKTATTPVQTRNGLVEGLWNKDKTVRAFAGIPFAKPPVGDLRWRAPKPVANWEGTYIADRFPKAPIQNLANIGSMGEIVVADEIDEDCLYLNIWTQGEHETEKKPVLVYIFPGGFTTGSSA